MYNTVQSNLPIYLSQTYFYIMPKPKTEEEKLKELKGKVKDPAILKSIDERLKNIGKVIVK